MVTGHDRVVIDDRLLVEELLVGLHTGSAAVHTTTYWYYRACRAAVLGAGGHLSGPFAQLERREQEAAIQSLLALSDDIGLPDPRQVIAVMADLAHRHPRLNLLDLEAAAAGLVLDATVWLSVEATAGVLPGVLDEEGIRWQEVALP